MTMVVQVVEVYVGDCGGDMVVKGGARGNSG